MNAATAALTAILDTDHLKKALQTLDNAYAVGLPRGNRDLEAEIMLFAMANEPIDAERAIAFSCRLSAVVASAQSSNVTAEILETQNDLAAQLATTQAQLKETISFIRSKNLLDEFNKNTENPIKVRGRRKSDPHAADTATPAAAAQGSSLSEKPSENHSEEQAFTIPETEPLDEPPMAAGDSSAAGKEAADGSAAAGETGGETGGAMDAGANANAAAVTNAATTEPGVAEQTPVTALPQSTTDESWEEVIAVAEQSGETATSEPGAGEEEGEKDMFRQLPSAYDSHVQEEFIVGAVEGIFTQRATADSVIMRNPEMHIIETKTDLFRIVPGGGSVLAGMPGGDVYIVASSIPSTEAECLTYRNLYIRNPGYVAPVVDED
jgi:hypothetical protein